MEKLTIKHCSIMWRNFEGRKTEYKPEGYRTFHVKLDEVTAVQLAEEGWSITHRPGNEKYPEDSYSMKVVVSYEKFAPTIWMITGDRKIPLMEETVRQLDYADLEDISLVVSPSVWKSGTRTGVTAYLNTLYAVVKEDELASEYSWAHEAEPSFPGEDDETMPF